jgi:hypothetical protein
VYFITLDIKIFPIESVCTHSTEKQLNWQQNNPILAFRMQKLSPFHQKLSNPCLTANSTLSEALANLKYTSKQISIPEVNLVAKKPVKKEEKKPAAKKK